LGISIEAESPGLEHGLFTLKGPHPAEEMAAKEAHKDVGNVRNNHPELLNSA
jgi:hypothetical protein